MEMILNNQPAAYCQRGHNLTMFESTRGASNVDLTIVDSAMVKLIHLWQCNEEESLSNHRYISYCIEKHKEISIEYDYNGAKYRTSEERFKRFENHFITEIK